MIHVTVNSQSLNFLKSLNDVAVITQLGHVRYYIYVILTIPQVPKIKAWSQVSWSLQDSKYPENFAFLIVRNLELFAPKF